MSSALDRRDALKWLAGSVALAATDSVAVGEVASAEPGVTTTGPRGTLTDPNLVKPVSPWPRLMSREELRTTAALADVIIPADDRSQSASAVGVPEFINEWVSAPYPIQQEDLAKIRGGIGWLNTESVKRFGREFTELDDGQKIAICDDLCDLQKAKAELRMGAEFFNRFRGLVVGGFYTTPEGVKDLGYVGNVALQAFPSPPREVLERLGLIEK